MSTQSLILMPLIATMLCLPSPSLSDELDNHPALARYPSPEEWQRRVETAKRDKPNEFAAARTDYDLAIRSVYIYKLYETMPIEDRIGKQVLIRGLWTRDMIADSTNRIQDVEKKAQAERFWREHIEEFVVDDSPIMRLVLAEAMLDEWEDWSGWTENDELVAIKNKFPRLHRHYAWTLVNVMAINDFNGLALRWIAGATPGAFADADDSNAAVMCISRDPNIDILDFWLKAIARSEDRQLQSGLTCIARSFDNRDSPAMRDAWAPYLTHANEVVRGEAVLRVAEMVRRIRIASRGRDNSDDLQARLQTLADSDSDSEVRSRAKYALEEIRKAEWRDDP